MSGGSYNYLCYSSIDDLVNGGHDADIQSMSDRLSGLGYADDAAKETEQLLLTLRQFRVRIESITDRLNLVWRSVEWWDSSDSSEESVIDALNKYRGEK